MPAVMVAQPAPEPAQRVVITAQPAGPAPASVPAPMDLFDNPEIAAALAAIAQPGVNALAPPMSPPPDWNALVAAANHFSPPVPPAYRRPGNAETLASWTGDVGEGSAHLAVIGNNLLSNATWLGVQAGASYAPAPFAFGMDVNGDQSGAWNAAASSQVAAGVLKFAASGRFASNIRSLVGSGQVGGSVSVSSAISESLSLDGALNWSRGLTSNSDVRGYQGTARVSRALGSDVKLIGTATVSGGASNTWVAPPQVYGSAGVQWTPGGGPALSASISDQFGGDYRLAMGASRPFN